MSERGGDIMQQVIQIPISGRNPECIHSVQRHVNQSLSGIDAALPRSHIVCIGILDYLYL